LQPPGNEREDLQGRLVEPLGVLGQDQQRRLGCDLAEQVEHGHRDPEPLRRRIGAQPEGGVEHRPLRGGQVRHLGTQRAQQLMQARERQISLGLHPGRAQHHQTAFAGQVSRHREQPRLADARLAVQHQRAATRAGTAQQRGDQTDLGAPAEQRPGVARRARHLLNHPPPVPVPARTCVTNYVS
jgi:hypothetical protein